MKFNFFFTVFFLFYLSGAKLLAQDLWVEDEAYNVIFPAGSVVQVSFDINFTINSGKSSNKEVNDNLLSSNLSSRMLNFLFSSLGSGLGGAINNGNNEELSNTKELSGILSGRLGEFDPTTRSYPIIIRREFIINNEPETISLSGVVSQNSITENEPILAHQIADLSFVFNSLSDSFTITEADIENFDLSPTGVTNQNNNLLRPEKRREIFVKYFNWILKDLFD